MNVDYCRTRGTHTMIHESIAEVETQFLSLLHDVCQVTQEALEAVPQAQHSSRMQRLRALEDQLKKLVLPVMRVYVASLLNSNTAGGVIETVIANDLSDSVALLLEHKMAYDW